MNGISVSDIIKQCGGSIAMAAHYATLPGAHKRSLTPSGVRWWLVKGHGIPPYHYRWIAERAGISIAEVHAANEALWSEKDLRRAS